jgi:hypothetical protein
MASFLSTILASCKVHITQANGGIPLTIARFLLSYENRDVWKDTQYVTRKGDIYAQTQPETTESRILKNYFFQTNSIPFQSHLASHNA